MRTLQLRCIQAATSLPLPGPERTRIPLLPAFNHAVFAPALIRARKEWLADFAAELAESDLTPEEKNLQLAQLNDWDLEQLGLQRVKLTVKP